jgi:TatD DNase family protein
MLFDTHCHLNIDDLSKRLDAVIADSRYFGIEKLLIPGVTIKSSLLALEIANRYENILVGVGIHPTEDGRNSKTPKIQNSKQIISGYLEELEKLIVNDKVVAVGEIGLDYYKMKMEEGPHFAKASRGEGRKMEDENEKRESQRELFVAQLKLAYEYKKAVIIHNRESKTDLLEILNSNWDSFFSQKMVFHCCEPDIDLLNFVKAKKIFIGVDGDITYKKSKQEFIKNIPLELLVLETDSPFLIPEPLKSQKIFPNEPKNLSIISDFISNLLNRDKTEFEKQVWENSNKLFLS